MKTRREFFKLFSKAGLVMGAIALHPSLVLSRSPDIDWIHVDYPERFRGYWHVKGYSKNGIIIEPSNPNAEEIYKISNPPIFPSK